MSPRDARHCSGCGGELGLEPVAEPSSLRCASCALGLRVVGDSAERVLDCNSCGGQFVEHDALRALLEQKAVIADGLSRVPAPMNPLHQKVVYRPCPNCQQLMNRKNFGGQSGIVVDVCARHGTWFDRGELPGVLAFVQAGGLQRSAAQAFASAERAAPAAAPLTGRTSWDEMGIATDFGLVASELLAYVVNRLKS